MKNIILTDKDKAQAAEIMDRIKRSQFGEELYFQNNGHECPKCHQWHLQGPCPNITILGVPDKK